MDAIKRVAEQARHFRPPALTTGLLPFCLILVAVDALEALDLTPSALFDINLNRLSFYSLVFWDYKQLLWQYALLAPLLGQYELRNGTVRAGIVLNVATVLPGVVSNLVSAATAHVVMGYVYYGCTSLTLVFAAFLSVNSWVLPRFTVRGNTLSVPGFTLVAVLLAALLVYRIDFWLIYVLCTLLGLGLGLGHVAFLVDPTSAVVEWIEDKLAPGIAVLQRIVHFVGEVEARELRERNFKSWRPSVPYLAPPSLTQP